MYMGNKDIKPLITGLYGCSCHSYSSWAECYKFHQQTLKIDDKVKHRCNGKIGFVIKTHNIGFVTVKYGNLACEEVLEHRANLINLYDNK